MFRLSGGMRVECGGTSVPIESPPVSGILAALLFAEGRLLHQDRLVEALWDDPPRSARSNVRLYLSRLRRDLAKAGPCAAARLVTQRGCGYGLKAGEDETDLTRFRKLGVRGTTALRDGDPDTAADVLGEALELWQGPVGQGCTASGRLRARFQAWDDLCLAVREKYLHAKIVQGHSTDLMPELHTIIGAAPFREASWANLIRAVYLSGDVSGALAAWQRVTTMLAEELGVDPSANIGDLHLAVLRRDDEAVRAYVHPAVVGAEAGCAGSAGR